MIKDRVSLRAAQAPLKQHYQDDPASAVVPVHATASVSAEGITCTVQGWAGPIRSGLHPATGGTGDDACSGDLLLQALLACVGVTMSSVAMSMSVLVRAGTLRAEATFDARGTLAVSREVPVGITSCAVHAELDTDADAATLQRLAALTERYCVVGQSLREPITITVVATADGG